MKKLTAAQNRYLDNATLIAASRLVFQSLEKAGTPRYLISEIADTTSGGTPNRKNSTYYGGTIPWIKSGELNDGLIKQAEEFITEEGLQKSSAKIYPKGTLVIALYGATVGKTGILDIDAASNQAVCAVTPKTRDVSNRFLFWFLRNKRPEFLTSSFGGAQPNISQTILRETSLPIPSLKLQKQICEFLEIVEQRQVSQKLTSLSVLPPLLSDVLRTVTQIEELVAKVEEARGLRSEAVREAELLLKCTNSHILDSDEWQVNRLETVLTEPPRNGLSPQRVVETEGRPMLRINAVSSSLTRYVDLSAHKLVDVSDDIAQSFTLQNDDVFIVRYNGDINRLAKAAIFKATEPSKVVYPDKLMRLRADLTKILPDFLVYVLGSRRVRTQVEELGITTAGQIGISGKNAKSFLISLPPIPEQSRIVSYLDDLQAKVDTLKQLQSETEAELNALLPSILDKAFKGEL